MTTSHGWVEKQLVCIQTFTKATEERKHRDWLKETKDEALDILRPAFWKGGERKRSKACMQLSWRSDQEYKIHTICLLKRLLWPLFFFSFWSLFLSSHKQTKQKAFILSYSSWFPSPRIFPLSPICWLSLLQLTEKDNKTWWVFVIRGLKWVMMALDHGYIAYGTFTIPWFQLEMRASISRSTWIIKPMKRIWSILPSLIV